MYSKVRFDKRVVIFFGLNWLKVAFSSYKHKNRKKKNKIQNKKTRAKIVIKIKIERKNRQSIIQVYFNNSDKMQLYFFRHFYP